MTLHGELPLCVCVTPWFQGFSTLSPFHLPTTSRGHGSCFPSHANEAMGFSRKGMWTHIPVPATETVFHAVTLLLHFLIHGSSRYSPQNLPTAFLQLSRVVLESRETIDVTTPTISWTFRHTVPSPSFPSWQLSLTENPSSKCGPLSLPTWVLGVILRKEALNSYWKSPTLLFHY